MYFIPSKQTTKLSVPHTFPLKAIATLLVILIYLSYSQQISAKEGRSVLISDPIPVKAVIVTMFEIGQDEGDKPGEFQFWKERRNLDTEFSFPHSHHNLFYNPDSQILGMVTGIGTAKSTSAVMALGLDERFDLSKAYWLIAGIAGIDPEDASIGSVAWSSYLVDGDLGYQIDSREIPKD